MSPSPPASASGDHSFEYRFLHRVNAASLDQFLAIEERLKATVASYSGYLSEVGPTFLGAIEGGRVLLYESVIRFDSIQSFLGWMDSQERRFILNPAERAGYRFEGSADWDGYSQWLSESVKKRVPGWKMNLLVLLVLYPTVMLLNALLRPVPWDFPAVLLLGNLCSVAITGWVLVPWASRVYRAWAEGTGSRRSQWLSLASIVVLLFLMLQIFRALPAAIW